LGFLPALHCLTKINDNAEAQKMEINLKGVNYTQKCSSNSKMALTVAVIQHNRDSSGYQFKVNFISSTTGGYSTYQR